MFTFLVPLVLSLPLNAQTQNDRKGNPPADSRLETLLKDWDKANQDIRELHFTIKFTTDETDPNQRMHQLLKDGQGLKDNTFRQGEGFFKKPKLGRVDWKDEKGNLSELFIWNDNAYERYDFEKKEKLVFPVPADNTRENFNWLGRCLLHFVGERIKWIFFDLPAAELKARFEITLSKEDATWAYLQLKPLKPDDKANFRELRIVLNQKTHLLRQICLYDVIGNRTIWDFENIEVNPTPPITLESISKNLPKGFREGHLPK